MGGFSFDVGLQRMRCKRLQGKALGPRIRTSEDPKVLVVHYSLGFTAYKVASNMVPRIDRSSDQGFLRCSLLHRILWSPTSKENPSTCCLINCEAKGCDVKGYKAKTLGPKIRQSEEPTVVL